MEITVTVLGCATSVGVPVLGCPCAVCTSPDSRNVRTRSSVHFRIVRDDGTRLGILVDTGPDLRAQLLREKILDIDAVLYTHTHADHVYGLDDLRPVHFFHRPVISIYGHPVHLETIQTLFGYAFRSQALAMGPIPQLSPVPVSPGEFEIDGLKVHAIEIAHGDEYIYGYRIGNIAYLTDCSGVPEQSLPALQGLKVLIIGALRHRRHPKHFTVQEARELATSLGVPTAIYTHMGHELDYTTLEEEGLADSKVIRCMPAFDGMKIVVAENGVVVADSHMPQGIL